MEKRGGWARIVTQKIEIEFQSKVEAICLPFSDMRKSLRHDRRAPIIKAFRRNRKVGSNQEFWGGRLDSRSKTGNRRVQCCPFYWMRRGREGETARHWRQVKKLWFKKNHLHLGTFVHGIVLVAKLADFAVFFPFAYEFGGLEKRHILRQIVSHLAPSEQLQSHHCNAGVEHRPTKRGNPKGLGKKGKHEAVLGN